MGCGVMGCGVVLCAGRKHCYHMAMAGMSRTQENAKQVGLTLS